VLVANEAQHGSNPKVSNLLNMMHAAKHGVLVLSDSDIAVPSDYLRQVADAVQEPGIGAVTCLYRGEAGAGFWSTLAAMGISYQFLPNALAGIRPEIGNTLRRRDDRDPALGIGRNRRIRFGQRLVSGRLCDRPRRAG
jgi:ceramide glucosyltransferase